MPFATLSVFSSLICDFCPSGQRFAHSFFQIPSHGGHPCRSAMCFVVAYAHLGLSPIRICPCWANKMHLHSGKIRRTNAFISLFLLHISSVCEPQYPVVGQILFLIGYPKERPLYHRSIIATHCKQRNAKISPAHKKSLQFQKTQNWRV